VIGVGVPVGVRPAHHVRVRRGGAVVGGGPRLGEASQVVVGEALHVRGRVPVRGRVGDLQDVAGVVVGVADVGLPYLGGGLPVGDAPQHPTGALLVGVVVQHRGALGAPPLLQRLAPLGVERVLHVDREAGAGLLGQAQLG